MIGIKESNSINLTILIVIYNMQREAPRTIFSALPPYQKGVSIDNYEILILENGSSKPLDVDYINNLPENVRYLPVPNPTSSPVNALNWGAQQAKSSNLLFCIDGARILSDGLILRGLNQLERNPEAYVYTLGWHLGPDVQMRSVINGYTRDVEDALLTNANWRLEPDRLFEISVLAGSSANAPFIPISESNAFFTSLSLFERIGGYDDRFQMPGGSLCNLEIFERYVTRDNALNILLLSEGTFHQVHGGAATSKAYTWEEHHAEYQRIFSRSYKKPVYDTMFADWPRESTFKIMCNTLQRLGSGLID